jgi:hypothetical protein
MHRNQPYYVKQPGTICQKRINTMIYYLFPKCMFEISDLLQVFPAAAAGTSTIISPSQFHYINEIKKRIQECDRSKWEKISLNPFTNMNETSQIKKVNICFYEILEIYSIMRFSWKSFYKLNSLHFGNDAGMTLNAFQYIRNYSKHDSSFLYEANKPYPPKDIHIQKRIDVAFCQASGENEYENGIAILKQILVVLAVQKPKGACIIKLGDTFTTLSLDILSFISHFYEKTYIMKPSVADLTTCEKYIICKNFVQDKIDDSVLEAFSMLYLNVTHIVHRICKNKPTLFISGKLEEINSIFGQPRLEYIHQLLSQSDNKHDNFKSNKQKCADWCSKYLV